jgi:hypothetical protein
MSTERPTNAVTAPIPQGTDRDPTSGRFRPGNAIARRHGLYAQQLADALLAEREAFFAQSITDDGGEDEVPARRRSLHAYRARLHGTIVALSDAIDTHGLFDRRGRLRSGWLQRLESLITTAHRLDTTLGLTRRAKRALSLEDYLDARAKEQG